MPLGHHAIGKDRMTHPLELLSLLVDECVDLVEMR